MNFSIIINSYNYARYLPDAIESALAQTCKPCEIVVVDDGSSDETDTVVRPRYADNPLVKWVRKKNAGQLSAFTTGIRAASGDVIVFLDADDFYDSRHVELLKKHYMEHPSVDFVFTAFKLVGETKGKESPPRRLFHDYGYAAIRTYFRKKWISGITSTISCRRGILRSLLPVFDECLAEWRICADECLGFGACLAGARKHFLPIDCVNYRIHGRNNCYNNNPDSECSWYHHRVKVDRLINKLGVHFGISPESRGILDLEFKTIPAPAKGDVYDYLRAVESQHTGFFWKLRYSCRILLLWSRTWRRGGKKGRA